MKNLILIGMPGCGKSSLGRIVAECMERTFVDADSVVEDIAGINIPEIFQREGEAGFRTREAGVLSRLGQESGIVIATGGGCVMREDNYKSLRQNGVIIFIERNLNSLARKGRPLSQNADLAAMYAERLPLYQRFADRTVQNDKSPDLVADIIMEAYNEIIGN